MVMSEEVRFIIRIHHLVFPWMDQCIERAYLQIGEYLSQQLFGGSGMTGRDFGGHRGK